MNPNATLPGNWTIDRKLGEGSYGVVYQVQRAVGRQTEWAAVKHVSIPRSESELEAICAELGTRDEATLRDYLSGIKDATVAEYLRMKQLQGHTNVVACNDIHVVDKTDGPGYDLYICMELLHSLSSRIASGAITRDETVRIGMDVSRALAVMNAKGFVHRDIKPQNIFVNDDGDYKLGDFGTARSLKDSTTLMSLKGTYAYMAPEIIQGKPAGFTADIYSLGLVMYRLMNRNKAPFTEPDQPSTAASMEAANARRLSGEPLPPPSEADAPLAEIICKACAFDPQDRWQSADELYKALQDLNEGTLRRRATHSRPEDQPRPTADSVPPDSPAQDKPAQLQRQRKLLIAVIIAACALLVLAGAFGIHLLNQSNAYDNADQALRAGRLEEAWQGFDRLGSYRDAADKKLLIEQEQELRARYDAADALLQRGDYPGALAAFQALGDYRDAPDKRAWAQEQIAQGDLQALFAQAEALEADGLYEDAMAIYASLGDYGSAAARHAELGERIASYKEAQFQEKMQAYRTAEEYYLAAGAYKDARAKAHEMANWQLYQAAQQLEAQRDFAKAAEIYRKLAEDGFRDASTRQADAEANIANEAQYQSALQLLGERKWSKAIAAFEIIRDYHDSAAQIRRCYYEIAETLYAAGELSEAQAQYALAGDYKDAAAKVTRIASEIDANQKSALFAQAESLEADGLYEDAMTIYASLGDYGTAAARHAELGERIASYKEAQFQEKMQAYRTAEEYYLAAGAYKDAREKAHEMANWQLYQAAQQLEAQRDFAKAAEIYRKLAEDGFRDASTRQADAEANIANEAQYQSALQLLGERKWSEAIAAFESIRDYHDSAAQIRRCYYEIAETLYAVGELSEAQAQYALAGDYKDAAAKVTRIASEIDANQKSALFAQAEALEADGLYEDAMAIYASLGDYGTAAARHAELSERIACYKEAQFQEKMQAYGTAEEYYLAAGAYKDAREKAHEMANWQLYQAAQQLEAQRDFAKAAEIYRKLAEDGFRDASTRLADAEANIANEAQYQSALQLLGERKWSEAIAAFESIRDYHDSAAQIRRCYYEIAETLYAAGELSEAQAQYALAGDYKDAAAKVTRIAAEIDANQKSALFAQAEALEADGLYEDAMAIYASLGDYGTAAARHAELGERIACYKEAQFQEKMQAYRTAEEYYLAAGAYKDAREKAHEMANWQLYQAAQQLEAQRDFAKAAEIYRKLAEDGFRDASTRQADAEANIANEAQYQSALQLLGERKWSKAIAAFESIRDYHDSAAQIRRCYYEIAETLYAVGELSEAQAQYALAGDYKDAAAKVTRIAAEIDANQKSALFAQAEALEADGLYEDAMAIYASLGDYGTAAARHAELGMRIEYYGEATLREAMEEYDKAESYYSAAGSYRDAEAKAREMRNWQLYGEAAGHMEQGLYKKAIAIYEKLARESFQDAAELLELAREAQLNATATDTSAPTAPPTPTPRPTAVPTPFVAPDAVFDENQPGSYTPAYSSQAFSSAFPGVSAHLREFGGSNRENRRQAKAGPGRQYANAGAFKPYKQQGFIAYFAEGDWVLVCLKYQTVSDRYVYFERNMFDQLGDVPQLSAHDTYTARTRSALNPSWGPAATFETEKTFRVAEGAEVQVLFEENGYAYAEFNSSGGLVRMWLPLEQLDTGW